MEESPRLRRLRWMCRRGMRELDVLLLSFIEREARVLEGNAWPELELLLSREDDCIWDWLQNPSSTPEQEFRSILVEIRRGPANVD